MGDSNDNNTNNDDNPRETYTARNIVSMMNLVYTIIQDDQENSITNALSNPILYNPYLLNMVLNPRMLEGIDTFTYQNPNNILQESLYDRNPIRNVVDENVIQDILISKKYTDVFDKDEHKRCAISLDYFNDNDDVVQLPCNHCFFVEPIMQWLTNESCECPICRYKLESVEKRVTECSNEVESSESGASDIESDESIPELDGNISEENNIYYEHTVPIRIRRISNFIPDYAEDCDSSDID
jgi:hypothetical protein